MIEGQFEVGKEYRVICPTGAIDRLRCVHVTDGGKGWFDYFGNCIIRSRAECDDIPAETRTPWTLETYPAHRAVAFRRRDGTGIIYPVLCFETGITNVVNGWDSFAKLAEEWLYLDRDGILRECTVEGKEVTR